MTVKQLIQLAQGGELRTVSDKAFTDEIVLGYINLGLLELYKRFPIKTGEAIINMKFGKNKYKLDYQDSDVQMQPNSEVLAIFKGFSEVHGELTVNERDTDKNIMSPDVNTVQIKSPTAGKRVSVIYKAAPEWLTDYNKRIPMPIGLLEAMLHYIGYRALGSINASVERENNTHYQRFEKSVAIAKQLGVVTEEGFITRPVWLKGYM